MNVLFVSAEVDPFAKVGGLADVVGSLPKALRREGIDARVLMPFYGYLDANRWEIQPFLSFELPRRTGTAECHLFTTVHDGVPIYFLRSWPFFGDEGTVYTDWNWDSPRFIFFAQAAIAAADALRDQQNWSVDVVHAHDWHTGLTPFLVNEQRWRAEWAGVGTMFTIHNMAYQGEHVGGWLWDAGVGGRHHGELESRGLTNNLLAIAIAYSDVITTVSPRYSVEIQYPYAGFGLDGLLRTRIPDLHGILNGIDTDVWNPDTDPLLISNYNAVNFEHNRVSNKLQLQRDSDLNEREDVPLIGLVSRLVAQKGIDLLIPAMRALLAGYDVQFVALGSGEQAYNDALWRLGADFHWKARVSIGFNAAVAQRIYAGSDMFVMPSHFEPCGVGQLIAMRYGSLPVVRETGGLADTVMNYDGGSGERGTGFVFSWEQPEALYNTLVWAIETYHVRRDAWAKMQRRAMQADFSWTRSAKAYADLYENAVARWRTSP
jgi:starch synthase